MTQVRIAIVYFSQHGSTQQLADAVAKGAAEYSGIDVISYRIEASTMVAGRFVDKDLFQQLSSVDAIIMGSPTYMGGVAAQFKAFIDATSDVWSEQRWANKIAAGFTCGSGINGDQTACLQAMNTLASQQGMLWVGLDTAHGVRDQGVNRLGCQLGVVAHVTSGQLHPTDRASACYLGTRVAAVAIASKPLRPSICKKVGAIVE